MRHDQVTQCLAAVYDGFVAEETSEHLAQGQVLHAEKRDDDS